MPDMTVVVGRFQTPYLHSGHRSLIKTAIRRTNKVCIIFVGYSDTNPTSRDPLPLHIRTDMVRNFLKELDSECLEKNVIVTGLKDIPVSDELWSSTLDSRIREYQNSLGLSTLKTVLLGGRDSFLKYYTGVYLGIEIPTIEGVSATYLRESVPVTNNQLYREGLIAAQVSKPYGNIYPTVDAIIYQKPKDGPLKILLGRKKGEKEWRMPGGYLDVTDKTLESAVLREAHEECGPIELGTPQYFTSCPIDSKAYRGTKDTVYTTVFTVQYLFGHPEAGDDLEEVTWFSIHDIRRGLPLHDAHEPILRDYVD